MTNTTAAPVLLESLLSHSYDSATDFRTIAANNADAISRARCGTEIVCLGNPTTIVAHRMWDDHNADFLTSPADRTTITDDGRDVCQDWCRCVVQDADVSVYYERWSRRGREAHGWACPSCRGIVQVG